MPEATIDRHEFFTRSDQHHNTGRDRRDERVQLLSLSALSL